MAKGWVGALGANPVPSPGMLRVQGLSVAGSQLAGKGLAGGAQTNYACAARVPALSLTGTTAASPDTLISPSPAPSLNLRRGCIQQSSC